MFCGRELILRDKAAKLLAWLDVFKQVEDVAVNYDPQRFALPWAGMRFVLVVESVLTVPFLLDCNLPLSIASISAWVRLEDGH